MSNKELIERATLAAANARRIRNHLDPLASLPDDEIVRCIREEVMAALAAVSDTTPSKPRREIHEPSFDRVYCVRCGGAWPCQTTPSEPTAKVVPISYEASASCSQGVCPAGCSHLMWECKACSCEGGWGASRERLEGLASQHVCVAAVPTPSEGEREAAVSRIRAKLDRIPDSDAVTLDKADVRAVLAPSAPVDRGKLLRQLETTLACTEHMLYEERAEQIVRLFGPAVTAFPTLGVPTESPESGSVAATVQAGLDAPVDREMASAEEYRAAYEAWHDAGRKAFGALREIWLMLGNDPLTTWGEDPQSVAKAVSAALAVSPAPARDEWEGAQPALTAISAWLDGTMLELVAGPEELTVNRVLKLSEEVGEVVSALIGAQGTNPRKGVTNTLEAVLDELLDVAVTALAAYEHIDAHQERALGELHSRILGVAARAGLIPGPWLPVTEEERDD